MSEKLDRTTRVRMALGIEQPTCATCKWYRAACTAGPRGVVRYPWCAHKSGDWPEISDGVKWVETQRGGRLTIDPTDCGIEGKYWEPDIKEEE